MGIENYSTIADDNDDASPDGWPEGMPAAGVNNSARQNMADTRTQWNDAEWFEFRDGTPDGVVTFIANNQFKIVSPTSADVTGHWHIGRRVQIFNNGTFFATITATSFSVDTTTVTIDSTPLTNVTLTAFASTIPLVNTNLPDNPTFDTITATVGILLGGTAAANLLDDYESGTFTATLISTGGTITLDALFDTMHYTKIGDLVHIQGNIKASSVSSPTGSLDLSSLPFPVGNFTDRAERTGFYVATQGLSSSINVLQGRIIDAGGTSAKIREFTGTAEVDVANKIQANTNLHFDFTYAA